MCKQDTIQWQQTKQMKSSNIHDCGHIKLISDNGDWWKAVILTSILQDLKRFLSPRQYFPPMVGLRPDTKRIRQSVTSEYNLTSSDLHFITRQHRLLITASPAFISVFSISLSVAFIDSFSFADHQDNTSILKKIKLKKNEKEARASHRQMAASAKLSTNLNRAEPKQVCKRCKEMIQKNTVSPRFGSIHSQFNQIKTRDLVTAIQKQVC